MKYGTVIQFQNSDPEKMIIPNKLTNVETLINHSFNGVFAKDYNSSKLGDSIIQILKDKKVNQDLKSSLPLKDSLVYPQKPNRAGPSNLEIRDEEKDHNESSLSNNSIKLNQSDCGFKIKGTGFGSRICINDLSLSGIQGEKDLKFTLFSQANKRNKSQMIDMPQLKCFKKFTYKHQGKDEYGNDINKEESDSDLDDSGISGTDKKILDEINGNCYDYCDETEEKIDVTHHLEKYRTHYREHKQNFGGMINFHQILADYYADDPETNLDDKEKIEKLEKELNELRMFKHIIDDAQNKMQVLQQKIEEKKDIYRLSIESEKEKLKKLSHLKNTNLTEYDKLRILSSNEGSNLDNYISIYDNNHNAQLCTENDEKNLRAEIENLKIAYNEKSNKYKEVIKKLKQALKNQNIEI